jgi:small multidrug resistance pump
MSYLLLGIAIIAEVIATSTLKASEGFTKLIPSLIVILGYSMAIYCLSLNLKTMSIGIAYAIWSGTGIVLIALIGKVFLQQQLDFAAQVGIGLIVLGVLVINLLSKSVASH